MQLPIPTILKMLGLEMPKFTPAAEPPNKAKILLRQLTDWTLTQLPPEAKQKIPSLVSEMLPQVLDSLTNETATAVCQMLIYVAGVIKSELEKEAQQKNELVATSATVN